MALAAGMGFGISVPLGAYTYSQGANVLGYCLLARLGLAAGLAALCAVHGKSFWPEKKFLPQLAAMTGILCIFAFLHFSAMEIMAVQLVTMIVFLYPLIASMLSVLVDRKPPSRIFIASAFMALSGLYLVLGPEWDGLNIYGAAMAFAAAFFIALSLFLNGKILQNQDPEIYGAQLMLGSLVVFLIWAAAAPAHFPVTPQGWIAALLSVCAVLLGQVTFFRAIQKLGAMPVGIYIKIEPVVTLFIAATLLGESMGLGQMIGAALVLAAIIWNSTDKAV